MHPIDDKTKSSAALLVILIAFAWIGYAYTLGAESERMILHPIVPILLILLLFGFRGDDSVRRAIVIAIVFISIWLFTRLQGVFMPFIIGFSLAYVVYVTLTGLQKIPIPIWKGKRIHLHRRAAIAALVILLIGIIAFFALGIVPQLVKQGADMQVKIGGFYTRVRDYTTKMLDSGNYPFEDRIPESWKPTIEDASIKISAYVREKIPSAGATASKKFGDLLALLSAGLRGTIGQISSAFFIFIVFIYAVQSFQSQVNRIKNLIPPGYRDTAVRYAAEIDVNMRAFLKGQLAVIVIVSIISAIVYSVIGVPFALLVGLLAGLCNAIPTIGPVLGGGIAILATTAGFVVDPYSLSLLLFRLALVVGAVFGIQILDNSLISPKIMSSALNIHPLVVLFAVLLSATLLGVWGAILAIPGVVVCKAFIKVSGDMKSEREVREMRQIESDEQDA